MSIETEEIKFQSEITPLERDVPWQNLTDHLRCCYKTSVIRSHKCVHFFFTIDGDEMFNDRISGIKGKFIMNKTDASGNKTLVLRETLNTLESVEHINKTVYLPRDDDLATIKLDFSITVLVEREPDVVQYEHIFVKSEINDTPLAIEGKTIYVNKGCLSVFSDYFRCLFSKDYIDHTLPVIRCELGTLDEVGMLLCTFYPPHIKPIPDSKVEQLLELAIRFQVPSVTETVNHHLAYSSKISMAKKIWIAEKFQLKQVIDKVFESKFEYYLIRMVKEEPYYPMLSDGMKQRIEQNQIGYNL